jgi:putative membrane protein
MVFTDILTSQLFVLGFVGLVLVYMAVDFYLSYRKGKARGKDLAPGSIPLFMLGGYELISGLFGQFLWPLPGSYNILFYDVYVMMGLVIISAAWAIRSKASLRYTGFLSMLAGFMASYYGIIGYMHGLSQAPIFLLLLYLGYGFSGILGFPVTVLFDNIQDGVKIKSKLWIGVLGLFALSLLLASILAILTAASAVPSHLASPP